MSLKLVLLAMLAMVAFAANSLFCRMALVNSNNDPISFTLVRMASGAIVLFFFFFKFQSKEPFSFQLKTFFAPLMLFSYALFFSLSYVQMDAGTGALILFASVQLTMMLWAFLKGQRMDIKESIGAIMAISGFIYLILLFTFSINLTNQGLLWAVLSGAVTSGAGYILWYMVLKDLVTSTAAIIQLSVPAIAAFGGVIFLGEPIRLRLVIASLLILSGIFIKVRAKTAEG